MDAATILLDTSILIDFFRKRDKSKSILFQFTEQYRFSISVITAFEIKIGIQTPVQQSDYDTLVHNLEVLPIDQARTIRAAASRLDASSPKSRKWPTSTF